MLWACDLLLPLDFPVSLLGREKCVSEFAVVAAVLPIGPQ